MPTEELERRVIELGLGRSLRDALERVDGPVVSRSMEARREKMVWDAVSADLRDVCAGCEAIVVAPDAVDLRVLCQRDHAVGERLVAELARVLAELGDVWVGELAARALGDSHALDRETLLFRLMARLVALPDAHAQEVWAAYGVALDSVSSSVLVLNVHFSGESVAGGLNAFSDAGEPCRVLLRHLRRVAPETGPVVYVCENPAVLEAAAERVGVACPPVICTEGQPSLACQRVLRALSDAGARVRYHGDFDWGGVRIANVVRRLVPAMEAWRFGSEAYEALSEGGLALKGTPVEAGWDGTLSASMMRRGLAFHEEQVLADLIMDLRSADSLAAT